MPFQQHFAALWNGTLDLSTTLTTFNMMRDVYEVCITPLDIMSLLVRFGATRCYVGYEVCNVLYIVAVKQLVGVT